MADILKRGLAPITDAAWAEIDRQAKTILKGNLSARAVVDMDGPHDWSLAAVNLGGVEPGKGELVKGVAWSTRKVLPLIEVTASFTLSAGDLDNLSRGGKTPELAPVVAAAQKIALCEEAAVYLGFKPAGIGGMLAETGNKAVTLPADADGFVKAVETGIHQIQSNGIGGPFDLVLGRAPYQTLAIGSEKGYPLKNRIQDLLGGGAIRWSPALVGGALVSRRGGDFELTVGQDFSIGYTGQNGDQVSFMLTESFTFRVLEPAAAVELKTAAKR
jgi:uncharacterized linocin/CFP29 family protein